jgi:hypothetical protein
VSPAVDRFRISLVLRDPDDEPLSQDVLESVSAARQIGAPRETYEIVVVANPERTTASIASLSASGAGDVVLATVRDSEPWWLTGSKIAQGQYVALVGAPGLASSTLVASLYAALDTSSSEPIVVRTFDLVKDAEMTEETWLRALHWPEDGHALVRHATLSFVGEPPFRWLDVIDRATNVVRLRQDVLSMSSASADPMDVSSRPRQQLLGDGFVRVREARAGVTDSTLSQEAATRTDPSVGHVGRVVMPGRSIPSRPVSFVRAHKPKLSVVVVVYNMSREAPRTLLSLSTPYQRGIESDEYEIIVVDNGSSAPLSDEDLPAIAPRPACYALPDAPPSPAKAINWGVAHATGDALAILVDGACLVSPGTLAMGLSAFRAFASPVVITRYFFLGPGDQADTISQGYDQKVEDALLSKIGWPSAGYRLFEIASPIEFHGPNVSWLSGWFESNCLFMPKQLFEEIGGCDERFDLPGGGLLVTDLLLRAGGVAQAEFVQLLGEGTFHQVHGGTTTNTNREDREMKDRGFVEQYIALRGKPPTNAKSWFFLGHLMTPACREKMLG